MLFEIVTPSDPYTIEASSLDVAAMAAILLGQGNYSFKAVDGGQDVPFLAFGGGDKWCRTQFGESLMEMSNRVMDTKLTEVADCLDSVLYGSEADRVEFLESTKDMNRPTFEVHRLVEQDRKRSSMNDIGERAYRMASKLRESMADVIATVQ